MRKNSKLLVGLSLLSVLACARERDVEKVKDFDNNRYAKSTVGEGQWLGKVTIVNNGSNSAFGFIGSESDVTLGHFKFTKDYLQYIDPDQVDNTVSGEGRVLNQWPIVHSEYHQKESGGRVSNVETENQDISWEQKKFFKINFSGASISEGASFPFQLNERCWNKVASRLVDGSQSFAADHINFTIAVDYQITDRCAGEDMAAYGRRQLTNTVEYMYSYMPDFKSDYKPYVYTGEDDPLMRKFGYFNTVVPYRDGTNQLRNLFLMNRWATGKTHTFYFAKGFPEEYKWIYNDPEKGVIARTNALFAADNVPLKFEIQDADENHVFGDIRYSFINFVGDNDEQAPLGYGPSAAHPKTGEIISAHTTMWTSSLRYYVERSRLKDERALAGTESSSIYRGMQKYIGGDPSTWTATASFLGDQKQADLYRFLVPDFTYGSYGTLYASKELSASIYDADRRLEVVRNQLPPRSSEVKVALEQAALVADELKAEVMSPKQIKMAQVRYLDQSLTLPTEGLTDKQIIDDILYRTAIHEFGHNLNLRHNFYGSVDGGTHRGTEKEAGKLKSSSVMDYLELSDELGTPHDWEAYDKAALLYAYSNGQVDRVKANGEPYLYCTDEHTSFNPLCNRFDSGTSPSEIVMSIIKSYEDNYWLRNFRDNRAYWQVRNYSGNAFRTMSNLKKFTVLHREAYKTADVKKALAGRTGLSEEAKDAVALALRNDLDQAIRLTAAFYGSVIRQADGERPFRDGFNPNSGSLERVGIFADKIYASRFLLGDDGIPLDPNQGVTVTSFLPLMKDKAIGRLLTNVMKDIYLNAGEGYAGFDDMGREYFEQTSATFVGADRTSRELTKMVCFTKASFEKAFNAPAPVKAVSLKPVYTADAHPYFASQAEIVVRPVQGYYYVAGQAKNNFAADLLLEAYDEQAVLRSYKTYSLLTEGRLPSCQ